MNAGNLLLTQVDVEAAFGPRVRVESSKVKAPSDSVGAVVAVAAKESAFRQFSGQVTAGGELPFAVSSMVLIFDAVSKAEHTFVQVAEAAHLRTDVDGSRVAVETVTAQSGLVSYWGFVQRGNAIVILTLDTLDPQALSIADLRSLVTLTADRLEALFPVAG